MTLGAERSDSAGATVVGLDALGTVIFLVTATYAAVVFDTTAQWVGSITALVLFGLGVVAFLWSFWNALQRSRTEQIAVSQLYLLMGSAIPASIRRRMNLLLVAQVLIALVTTFARPNGPDGSPGSSLAVGFLVPMFGIGLNGVWAAYHGRFAPRPDVEAEPAVRPRASGNRPSPEKPSSAEKPSSPVPIGQNAPMAETASEFTTIAAGRDAIWEIVLDVERYPEWAKDIKQAVIRERDADGRPLEVEFVAAALGRSTHYTLAYDYSGAPERLTWTMVKGDIQREITGGYTFTAGADGSTDVQYDVVVELVVPLPGFVKRRAEVRILNTLKELATRVEGS